MKLNWDPDPSERKYYRSTEDGQRGYLVRRDGKELIRYDRPMEEILADPAKGNWVTDQSVHPLSSHQLAKVAFEADRALCAVLNIRVKYPAWLDMPEKARIQFMEEGPDDDGIRDQLYAGIMITLKELTGG